MTSMGKAVVVVVGLAICAALVISLFVKLKPTGVTMAYHRVNLDTEEDVSFATKAECVGGMAWVADPPYAFTPSGYKCYKDGGRAQPCAFRSQANGFQVAQCEECVRSSKPTIEEVQAWISARLP